MNKNIVILAGGASSRMKDSVASAKSDDKVVQEAIAKPKAMLTLRGRPFLDYLLSNVEAAGYADVVIVVGQGNETIRRYYFQEGNAQQFPKLSLSYVPQSIPEGRTKPLGTADALLQALIATPRWKGHRFTVCNSDNLYSTTALRLLLEDAHDNAMIDYDSSALHFSDERVAKFAVIQKETDGFVSNIIEKPSVAELNEARDSSGRIGVSMNIWRFSYEHILHYLEAVPLHPQRNEKELPVTTKLMIEQNPKSLYAIPLSEHVPDLTTLLDFADVLEYLKVNFPHFMR